MAERLRNHVWLVIAACYLAVVVTVDLTAGRTSSYTGLLALVPVLLSFEWDWRGVACSGVVMIALSATDMAGFDQTPTHSVVIRTAGVAVGSGLGVFASMYRIRREHTLVNSRAVSATAQRAILPAVPPRIGPYSFQSLYRSAVDEASIGGDFYKVADTDSGVRFIIGDVQGKGLDAVKMSAIMLGCFREWAPETAGLKDLVDVLDDRVKSHGETNQFVTGIVATLRHDLTLEMANCGHPAPALFRDGAFSFLTPERAATPFGLSPTPVIQTMRVEPGDRLLLYTDGLIENRDAEGRWIEIEELLGVMVGVPGDRCLPQLLERLDSTARRPADDLALLLASVD
jgi:sigma-B regulation protein RsbU (phosphoserine phosphatase)